MPIFQVIILAIVQGLAELLPVSSSAHVVVAEKLLHLDPSSPQMTLVLVMLHTGTMFAVIVYFWKQWKKTYFASMDAFKRVAIRIVWATLLTGVIGEVIIKGIEKTAFKGQPKAEIELLFGRLNLVAPALAAAGILILIAGLLEKRRMAANSESAAGLREGVTVTMRQAGWIGAVQGLCLPFRGFSRSGATISTGMLAGANKDRAERFSFALAVVLTPPVVPARRAAPDQGHEGSQCKRHTDRPARNPGQRFTRRRLRLHRRPGRVEVAQQLVGVRSLVSLRHLLPRRLRRRLLSLHTGLLTR